MGAAAKGGVTDAAPFPRVGQGRLVRSANPLAFRPWRPRTMKQPASRLLSVLRLLSGNGLMSLALC